MNEIAKLVSEKTGLPLEVSTIVVDVAFNFIKGKLPPELAGEIDRVADPTSPTSATPAPSGADAAGGLLGKVEGMLGGILGGGQKN